MVTQIVKGRDLMLFDNSGHSYAYATNHTFTITAETTDISSKDHGIWGASEVSRYTWEITSENLYTTEAYNQFFDQMMIGSKMKVRFGLKTEQTDLTKNVADGDVTLPYWTSRDVFYEGDVIITSLVANASNGDNATFSITLTGTGAVKRATVSSSYSG